MTSIARNPTEMATKNIKKKKWQPKNKQMQTQKKGGNTKYLLALLKFHANSFMVTTVGVIPTTPFSL